MATLDLLRASELLCSGGRQHNRKAANRAIGSYYTKSSRILINYRAPEVGRSSSIVTGQRLESPLKYH